MRPAIAHHEAGHVVFGLKTGAALSKAGADIIETVSAGVFWPFGADEADEIPMLVAGPVAELWFGRTIYRPQDEAFGFHLAAARAGEERSCDFCRTFSILLTNRPGASDAELVAVFRQYEEESIDDVKRTWPSIWRVAQHLIAHGRISDQQARDLIDVELLPGRTRDPMAPLYDLGSS